MLLVHHVHEISFPPPPPPTPHARLMYGDIHPVPSSPLHIDLHELKTFSGIALKKNDTIMITVIISHHAPLTNGPIFFIFYSASLWFPPEAHSVSSHFTDSAFSLTLKVKQELQWNPTGMMQFKWV